MKHILFFLPEYYEVPIGGYKVVFEYANRFIEDGHNVSIVYPSFLFFWKSSLKRKLKMIFFFLWYKVFPRKGIKWFNLDKKIQFYYPLNLEQKNIPQADIYIATAMETSVYLNQYTDIEQSRKFYLIQALEDWQWGKKAALETWKLPLNKIVISPWLYSIAESLNEKAIVIENGVDREGLYSTILPEQRNRKTIMMLYHKQKLKGCDDGLKALNLVKEKHPDLCSIWFGTPNRPKGLPEWIEYYKMPDNTLLRDLYNRAAIFIGTSHNEGFGLTIGEAMTCCCSVACTDNGGYLTMGKHMETALISPVGDYLALASNILTLIENDNLRIALAKNGNKFIRDFTWDSAYRKMSTLLLSNL